MSCVAAISTEVTMPTSYPHPSCPSDVNIVMSLLPRTRNLDYAMPHPTIFCEYKFELLLNLKHTILIFITERLPVGEVKMNVTDI